MHNDAKHTDISGIEYNDIRRQKPILSETAANNVNENHKLPERFSVDGEDAVEVVAVAVLAADERKEGQQTPV